jgi:predicted transcriptional regulator
VRAILAPLIGSAVAAATAVVRPLNSIPVFAPVFAAGSPAASTGPVDAASFAMALERALAGPLDRLAEAADRLGSASAGPSREQTIDAALAEIRAGIERLLDAAGHNQDD